MARLNGPYINWLALLVVVAILATAACHFLAWSSQYWWPVVAKGVGG